MPAYGGDEDSLQKFVIELLRFSAKPGVIYFHVPNGGLRSKRTAARMKALGVRAGVADIVLIGEGARAYFLELKTARGTQSADQRAFEDACQAAEVPYRLARSPEAARAVLRQWDLIREAA